MKILDYGSGERENVLDFWRENHGIAALRKYVQSEVGNIIIHALDPLEIDSEGMEEKNGIQFHFHKSFQTIPPNMDIICALNPNPEVLNSGNYSDDWSFHHLRYLGFLNEVIWSHLRPGGQIVLQFDDEMKKASYGTGVETFISKLHRFADFIGGYSLEELRVQKGARFSHDINYTFSSFHLFRKVETTSK